MLQVSNFFCEWLKKWPIGHFFYHSQKKQKQKNNWLASACAVWLRQTGREGAESYGEGRGVQEAVIQQSDPTK